MLSLKYYFCCLWCCKPREYVDYEKVMLREAALISEEEIGRHKAHAHTMNCEDQFQKYKRKIMEQEKIKKKIIEEYEKNKKLEEQANKPVIILPNKLQPKNSINYQISAHKNYLYKNRIEKQPINSRWTDPFRPLEEKMEQIIIDISNNEIKDSSGNLL